MSMDASILSSFVDSIHDLSDSASRSRFEEQRGELYFIDSAGNCQLMPRLPDSPERVECRSLMELATLINCEQNLGFFGAESPLYVSCDGYDHVTCFGTPVPANRMERPVLYTARAIDIPGFQPQRWSVESAIVALRTNFKPTDNRDALLDLISNISAGNSVTQKDNGAAQTVTVNSGVGLKEAVSVKPIFDLAPYRTWQEIDQPETAFLVRFEQDDKGTVSVTLREADGAGWRFEARKRAMQYLMQTISPDLLGTSVFVTL